MCPFRVHFTQYLTFIALVQNLRWALNTFRPVYTLFDFCSFKSEKFEACFARISTVNWLLSWIHRYWINPSSPRSTMPRWFWCVDFLLIGEEVVNSQILCTAELTQMGFMLIKLVEMLDARPPGTERLVTPLPWTVDTRMLARIAHSIWCSLNFMSNWLNNKEGTLTIAVT